MIRADWRERRVQNHRAAVSSGVAGVVQRLKNAHLHDGDTEVCMLSNNEDVAARGASQGFQRIALLTNP